MVQVVVLMTVGIRIIWSKGSISANVYNIKD